MPPEVVFDLLVLTQKVATGQAAAPELLGALSPPPIVFEAGPDGGDQPVLVVGSSAAPLAGAGPAIAAVSPGSGTGDSPFSAGAGSPGGGSERGVRGVQLRGRSFFESGDKTPQEVCGQLHKALASTDNAKLDAILEA